MSDRTFELSLSSLAVLALLLIAAGIVLAATGLRLANTNMPLLIFLTILTGLVVLLLGGGALLYYWGKNYMSRG